jgi:hypothetical protein
MNRFTVFLLLLCLSINSYSQNFIKGIVTDSLEKPVPFCSMILLNAKDSSQVKGNISDSSGTFIFEKVKSGNYFIKFNAVGYGISSSSIFSIDSLSQLTYRIKF